MSQALAAIKSRNDETSPHDDALAISAELFGVIAAKPLAQDTPFYDAILSDALHGVLTAAKAGSTSVDEWQLCAENIRACANGWLSCAERTLLADAADECAHDGRARLRLRGLAMAAITKREAMRAIEGAVDMIVMLADRLDGALATEETAGA